MKAKNLIFKICAVAVMAIYCSDASAQLLGVKTNALLWGNLTPNLSLELVSTKKTSLEGTVFYSLDNTPLKTKLMGAQMEMRYWISGRPMNRLFVGLSLSALRYDSSIEASTRHQGDAVAPGIVYGYALPLGNRWNLEFAAGVGYFLYRERKYAKNEKNFGMLPYNEKGGRMLPTKLSISCAYLF